MRKYTKSYIAGLASLIFTGCTAPFATSINELNFSAEQQPAVIQLSDPQVYARETLINDRRKEVAYLNELIRKSETIKFRPQLKRDLQTLTGFVAQLQASLDVGAGKAFQRDEALRDLEFERERIKAEESLIRAKADLLRARKELEEAQNDNSGSTQQSASPQSQTSAPTATTGDGVSQNASGSSTSDSNEQTPKKVEDLKLGEINSLLSRLDKFRDLFDRLDNASPIREADVQASPQDTFRDRQAYRSELRAALADVNLDDVHDIEGNALYRLQFRATVLPGEHNDQVAATRLTIKPPVLSRAEVARLYGAWLSYVNRALNSDKQGSLSEEYELIGELTGLYDIIYLNVDPEFIREQIYQGRRSSDELKIAALPGTSKSVAKAVGPIISLTEARRKDKAFYKNVRQSLESAVDQGEWESKDERSRDSCPSDKVQDSLTQAVNSVHESLDDQQRVVAVLLTVLRSRTDKEV